MSLDTFANLRYTLPVLLILLTGAQCTEQPAEEPRVEVVTSDLYRDKNQTYTYVRGDLEDCRNLSIRYLEGDIKGHKTFGLQIEVMRGNIVDGQAKINVLHGDIVGGKGVVVNLLIGEDFTGQAKVLKQIDPADAEKAGF
ncbi:MAG: hypothetical protein CMN76_08520 [Spirochaetaceae bacterium]|nr:hypothetical protein [Spirochaetaceae bacterium]|tara:strand:- start:221 stop:640 length:420 start_codon:yes stop_codon:yes gene_type:complete